MRLLLLVLFLSCGIVGWATTTTSVTCSAAGAPTVTNPSSCSTGVAGAPSSNASSAATVSADYLTYTFNQTVNGIFAGDSFSLSSTASASGETTFILMTTGAVRSGYLRLLYSPVNWAVGPADFTGTLGVTVGSVSTTCGITILPSCAFPLTFNPSSPLIPFTLGQSFLLDIKQLTTATAEFDQGSSRNTINTGVTLQIFDTDGVTRVAVAPTPEPASRALITVFGAALFVGRALRRRTAR